MKYENYKGIIIYFANRHAKQGFDFNELVSEGNLIFLKAETEYDEKSKIKFSTFLYRCLRNGLSTYIRKVCRDSRKTIPHAGLAKYQNDSCNPLQAILFKESIANLSNEAKDVVNTVLDCPTELIEFIKEGQSGNCRVTKQKVSEYLHLKGWEYPLIWHVFSEIKNCFN